MKKNLFILLLLLFSFSTQLFSQKIDDIFKAMPESILPGTNEDTKSMLFIETKRNSIPYLDGDLVMLSKTNDFLKLKTSSIGTIQIKILPLKDKTNIICLIRTVCGNSCSSNISFYTTKWEPLDKKNYLKEITADIFLNSNEKGSDKYKYALSLLSFCPIAAEFSESKNELNLQIEYKSFLTAEQIDDIKPIIKCQKVCLKWDNKSLK